MHINFGSVLGAVRGKLGQAKAATSVVPQAEAVVAAAKAGDPVTALETAEQAAQTVGALIGQPGVSAGATLSLEVTEEFAPVLKEAWKDLGPTLEALWHHGRAVGHAEAAAGLDHAADAAAKVGGS